jgi:response regulator RpfG family c-di-GMP phosphodiesterase
MLCLAHGPACRQPWPQAALLISRQTMRQSVVVIDDQTSNSLLIAEILSGISADLAVLTFDHPLEAVKYAADHPLDLVVTDFSMPELDGIGVIRLLKEMDHLVDLPIVVVTASDDLAVRYAALDAGAADFLIRPINPRECQSRCRNLLKMRSFQLQNKRHAELLQQRVAEVTEDLQSRSMEMLQRLAVVAEKRDSETGQHLVRMARYSKLLAREVGFSESEVHVIGMAAPLHDIGKIGIPDGILLAPRRLTESELVVMRTHPDIGYEMLHGSTSESMKMSADIARYHHERFDGSGYPLGLRGEDIPLSARIVAVADVWDALLATRPYKRPWTEDAAIDLLRSGAGAQFDPALVDAFLANLDTLRTIRRESDRAAVEQPPDVF